MESTLKKQQLPTNRLDYSLVNKNKKIVAVVEAKRPG